jgi:hypothetical protein
MGVDRTDYLMFGVDVGYDAFSWDKHEAEIEGRPDARFDVVYDGMRGKYCVAGKIIAASDRYEGFEGRIEIDPADLAIDRDALARKIADAFDKDVSAGDFRLVLFSHFH